MTFITPPPGWLHFERIKHRIRWDPCASSYIPQLNVKEVKSTSYAMGSVFSRQENWSSRCYNRKEQERITNRAHLKPGEANIYLQKLRSAERSGPDTKQDTMVPNLMFESKNSEKNAIFRDLADESIASDPHAFEKLASSVGAVIPRKISVEANHCNSPLVCQRCHDLRQNEYHPNDNAPRDTSAQLLLEERDREIIHGQMMSRSVIVMVADLMDFPWSFSYSAFKLLQKLMRQGEDFPGIFLVGNKLDLLPKHMQDTREYFEAVFFDNLPSDLKERFIGSQLVSAKTGAGLVSLAHVLLHLARERDGNIFLLGRTNVGKSQLYNQLVGKSRAMATVSKVSGTTISAIKNSVGSLGEILHKSVSTPINDRLIIDLPGIIDTSGFFSSLLTAKELDKAQVSRKVSVARKMLKTGETGLFGGLIRISCVGEDPTVEVRLKCQMRPDWKYFRISRSENVDSFVDNCLDKTSHSLPYLTGSQQDDRFDLFRTPKLACQLDMVGKEPREIVFSDGIGWISAHLAHPEDRVSLLVHTPSGLGAMERPPLAAYLINKNL